MLVLFSLLALQLPFVEAQTNKEAPTVDIENNRQVVKVKWAKAFTKADSHWLRMRFSRRRVTSLPPNIHLHVGMYDDEGKVLRGCLISTQIEPSSISERSL